jgi:hypothetical protein
MQPEPLKASTQAICELAKALDIEVAAGDSLSLHQFAL